MQHNATAADDAEMKGGCYDQLTLILIKHCHDMKRNLTLITMLLLLLLTCSAGFLFIICSGLWTRQNSSEQTSAAEKIAVHSKQQSLCQAETTPTNKQRFYMQLRSLYDCNATDYVTVKWDVESLNMANHYSKEKHAIVIPQYGAYFVYVRLRLACHTDYPTKFINLSLAVNRWNPGYGDMPRLIETIDGLTCTKDKMESKNVFVGHAFNLMEGDHVNVMIAKGYKLINSAFLGVYLI